MTCLRITEVNATRFIRRVVFVIISFLIIVRVNTAFSQPPQSEFENNVKLKAILSPDSNQIALCSEFKENGNSIESELYRISYYTHKGNVLLPNTRFSSDFWICSFGYQKAHQACREVKYQDCGSAFDEWEDRIYTLNVDSIYDSVQFKGASVQEIEELDSMRMDILYGGYNFTVDPGHKHSIIIEEILSKKRMIIILVGHDSRFPSYTIETIIFKEGTYIADLQKCREVTWEGHVLSRTLETPLLHQ